MLTYVNLPHLLSFCAVFRLRAPIAFSPAAGQNDHSSFRALLNSTPNISLQSDRATVYLGEHLVHG